MVIENHQKNGILKETENNNENKTLDSKNNTNITNTKENQKIIIFRKRNGLIEKIHTDASTLPEDIRKSAIEAKKESEGRKQKLKEITKKVTVLLKEKDYHSAEELLLESISENPTNIYFLTNLIRLYGETNKTAAAREIFNYAITIEKSPYLYSAMIFAYGKNGEVKKAEEIYNEMPEDMKHKQKIEEEMFEVYYHNDNIEKAGEIFQKARENGFSKPKMYTLISEYEEKKGKIDEAIRVLECAINEKKDDSIIHTRLIKLYGSLGRIKDAERIFYGYAFHKQDHLTYSAMVDAYIKNGMLDKANKTFENLKSNGITFESSTALLKIAKEKGNVDKAKEIFEEMKAKNQADIITYTLMLSLYEKYERYEEGKILAEEMLKTQKNDEKSYMNIIAFYGKIKDIKKAEEVFQIAKNSYKTPSIYSAMMKSYYNSEKHNEAIKIFLRAPENILESEECIALFIENLRKNKDYKNVVEISDILMERKKQENTEWDKTYIKVLLAKAYALKDSGKIGEAIKIFNEVLEKIDTKNTHYPRTVCGLIFCCTIMEKEKVEEIKKNLIYWLDKKGENCHRDILNALKIIKEHYEIEFNEEEIQKINLTESIQ